jgi:DNA-binding MarR family transcriptional regulator
VSVPSEGVPAPDSRNRSVTGTGLATPPSRPPVLPTSSARVTLTDEDFRISARLLLHIDRQPRFVRAELVPESLTQAGMAKALGTSQAGVSNALRRLLRGKAIRVERSPVRHRLKRLKVYQLTAQGEAIVQHIRAGMGLSQGRTYP